MVLVFAARCLRLTRVQSKIFSVSTYTQICNAPVWQKTSASLNAHTHGDRWTCTMTVSVCWRIASWSSASAVYSAPVPGSRRNLRRLKGSVLLSNVKVSLFFSSWSVALSRRTSVSGAASSGTLTSYRSWENCGRWLLVSITLMRTWSEEKERRFSASYSNLF